MTNDLTSTIHTYLTTAPSSEFNGLDVRMVDHWAGRDNLLWRVDAGGTDAVLKLFLDAGQARSRRQFDGHQIFAPLGLAPQPLWVDRYPEGLARQVLVYRWADGEPFQAENEEHWSAAARTLARLHAADPGAVRRFSPNPINLAYLWRLLETTAAQVDRWLAAQSSPLQAPLAQLHSAASRDVQQSLPAWQNAAPAPVHGDLNAENLIVQAGETMLLDWEQFGLGDPAQDVASFLHSQQQVVGRPAIDEWLDLYVATGGEPDSLFRIGAYRRLLPYRDLLYLLDGLRELTLSPTALAEHRDTLPFLNATIQATADAARQALDPAGATGADRFTPAVDALIARISANEPPAAAPGPARQGD